MKNKAAVWLYRDRMPGALHVLYNRDECVLLGREIVADDSPGVRCCPHYVWVVRVHSHDHQITIDINGCHRCGRATAAQQFGELCLARHRRSKAGCSITGLEEQLTTRDIRIAG